MNYFLKTDYHNRPLRVLDVAELQFPSIAWKAKKGNVKDGTARWRAVSEVLCYRADSPHPYTGLRAHSAPQPTAPPPHRRARSWGDPSEREERKTERGRTFKTHIQHFLYSFHNMKSCAQDVIGSQGDLHKETGWCDFDSVGILCFKLFFLLFIFLI